MMETKCTDCGKLYGAQGYDTVEGTCYACALESITGGRPPETEDITTAYFVSREMTKEEWRDFQAELRRYHPGDFYEEKHEWCDYCNNYTCHCAEYEEEDRQRLEMEELYWEAIAEDQERSEIAEQARRDAEEEQAAYRDKYYDSFSVFWYDFAGWNNYNRLVAPVLIGWLRFKKR